MCIAGSEQNQKSCVAYTRVSEEKLRQCEGLECDTAECGLYSAANGKAANTFLNKGSDVTCAGQ